MNEHVHIRGSHKNLGEVVPRRFLTVLGGSSITRRRKAEAAAPSWHAGWSTRRSIRLLPRVLVNRLWQHHFGEGIVRSTDDFGAMGQKPSHPELLDWLAARLVESGWSIKAMHRLMLTSSTYRMSSMPDARCRSRSIPPTRSCTG